MAKFSKFLKQMAYDVYWGEGNTDNQICPNCGEQMNFHGGDRPIGEGFWDCDCGYNFTEDDISVSKYDV